MPIYEYECPECHHEIEVILPEPVAMLCPRCDDDDVFMDRKISTFSFEFAGDI